jgi:pantoate--beta-alanine ligase
MTQVQQLDRIADVRRQVEAWRAGGPIGIVPTMGALHAGHVRLIQQARAECVRVVVSIFVNPLQFDLPDDLDRYPRTPDADAAICERLDVDLLFVPTVDQMYPIPPACTVDPGRLGDHLCGAHRAGHFRGVATVVLKLLSIVTADRAYFGEKDAQQLAIVRRMVADFDLPVTIVGVPTVREEDGLAISSRNIRLNARERKLATALYHALSVAHDLIRRGVSDAGAIRRSAAATIGDDEALRLEYLEIVDHDMQPVDIVSGPVTIAGALWVGNTRLIDNIQSDPVRPA